VDGNEYKSTRRKGRRLTLRIASLIISGKMNQHHYATVKIYPRKLEQDMVVDGWGATLTSV
jgi:hypothetical protein